MSLILHHVVKDLRAQRWLLTAWAIVLLATAAIEATRLQLYFTSAAQGSAILLNGLLPLAGVVLAWVLAARFVHADPADGGDAFWVTRPISRWNLIAAKAVVVGGLLVVPAAAAGVVFVANGVPWSRLPASVGSWLLFEALFLVPLTLLATLTRDLARMVLATILAMTGWTILRFLSAFSIAAASVGVLPRTRSAWLVLVATAVGASALLAVQQYVTRRTRRTASAGLAVLVALVAAAALGPIQTALRQGTDPFVLPSWGGASVVSVSVPADSVRVRTDAYFPPGGAGRAELSHRVVSGLDVRGLGDRDVLRVTGGRGVLSTASESGPEFRYVHGYGPGFYAGALLDSASRGHFEQAIGARLLEVPSARETSLELLAIPTSAEYARFEDRPARYQATVEFEAWRIASVSALPLRAAASGEGGGPAYTILSVEPVARDLSPRKRDGAGCRVLIRLAAPRAWLAHPPRRVEVVVRNRRRDEALIAWGGDSGQTRQVYAGSFVVSALGSARFYSQTTTSTIDDAWLADAELVLVALEPLGVFEKSLRIDNLVLPPVEETEKVEAEKLRK